jgi:hypothetical protein
MIGRENYLIVQSDVVNVVARDGILGQSIGRVGAERCLQPTKSGRVERAGGITVDAGWSLLIERLGHARERSTKFARCNALSWPMAERAWPWSSSARPT